MTGLQSQWRRCAASVAGALAMGAAAAPALAQTASAAPAVVGGAATLALLPTEARHLPAMAPDRQMVVLSRADFGGAATLPALRAHLTPYIGAAGVGALSARHLNDLLDSINTGSMTAMRLDTGAQRFCLITTDASVATAQHYAGALAGIPAEQLGHISGTAQQWRMTAVFHEAGHCAQNYAPYSQFHFTNQLQAERDADQRMLRVIESLPGYAGVAPGFRAMRALAAVHFSGLGHMTAAGLTLSGETPVSNDESPSVLLASMNTVNAALKERAASVMTHRPDLHVQAVRDVLAERARFTPATHHATDPVLSRQTEILRDIATMRFAQFISKYETQADFTAAVGRRAGSLLAEEVGSAETYSVFTKAARALIHEGTLAHDPRATRFLQLYIDATSRMLTPTAQPSRAARPAV